METNPRLNQLLERLEKVTRHAQIWKARCPAHEDGSPSLAIKIDNRGNILLYDFAGCATKDIMSSLGLPMSLLFAQRLGAAILPAPSAAADVKHHLDRLARFTYAFRLSQDESMLESGATIAGDFWVAVEKYRGASDDYPPYCFWVCSLNCQKEMKHEEGCAGCNKTAKVEGLCQYHAARIGIAAPLSVPYPGRSGSG